jgi:hypothetical protein
MASNKELFFLVESLREIAEDENDPKALAKIRNIFKKVSFELTDYSPKIKKSDSKKETDK